MMSNQSESYAQVSMGVGDQEYPVKVVLEAGHGAWTCLGAKGGCGATGVNADHLVALGAATLHNLRCQGDFISGDDKSFLTAPRRARRITGPHGAVVTITSGRWDCQTCQQTGVDEDEACLAAIGGIHTVLCGATDSEAAAATLVKDNDTFHHAMSEWVGERVEGGLAELQEQLANSLDMCQLAEQATELEHERVKELEAELAALMQKAEDLAEESGRNLARAIKAQSQITNSETEDLSRQIAAIRADLPRADTKAQQQLGLTSFIGGGVIAVAGLTGVTVAALPIAAIVLAVAAGVGVAAVAGLTSAVMWPAKRGRNRGYSDSEVLKERLEAEQGVVQAIADRKFTLLRLNTLALAGTVLSSVAALVTALVGGA